MRLDGVNCLPVTPFTAVGELDERSMRRLVDYVIDGGVASVIGLGRVGEVTYLTMDERATMIDTVTNQVAGRWGSAASILPSKRDSPSLACTDQGRGRLSPCCYRHRW